MELRDWHLCKICAFGICAFGLRLGAAGTIRIIIGWWQWQLKLTLSECKIHNDFIYTDEGSEVESEIEEELDDSGEPQAKREKTEISQAFQVGCLQPVLESGVQQNLLNPLHNEHIVTATQTIRQCSATGNTYTAV